MTVRRRVADVVSARPDDLREPSPEDVDDLARLVDRERGLREIGDTLGLIERQRFCIVGRLDEHGCVGRLAEGALDLLVAVVADEDDSVPLAGEAAGFEVHFGDERTGAVDDVERAGGGAGVDRGRDAVGAEDEHRAVGYLGLAVDENGPVRLELAQHMLVVHDLFTYVNRRPEATERLPDRVNGALDPLRSTPGARRGGLAPPHDRF